MLFAVSGSDRPHPLSTMVPATGAWMSPWDGNPCKPKPQTTFVTLPLHLSRRTRWLSIACRHFTLFHGVVIDLRGENIMKYFHGLHEIIALDF
jgi:hypothetical protein